MYDVGTAVKRPFSNVKSLIMGMIFLIIPILNLAAIGYLLKCAKTASQGDYSMPEWTDWGGLIVSGLLSIVIIFVYMIPGMILAVIGGVLSVMGDIIGIIGLIVSFLSFLFFVLGVYFGVIALIKYAIEGSVGSAFSVGAIIKKGLKLDYVVTLIVGGIISDLMIMFTLGLLSFPAMVHFYTALGETYSKL